MSKHERLDYLYRRYTEAIATEEEVKELFALSEDRQQEPRFLELMNITWMELEETDRLVYDAVPKKVVPLYKRGWYRIAAAAVFIFAIATGVYFGFSNKEKDQGLAGTTPTFKTDIPAPQTNRATITLANGQQVFLDSAGIGTLVSQGNVTITKSADGEVAYTSSPAGEGRGEVFNTLFNPRGSKVINLTLVDGTKVWLNAESSLKYPVAFTGKERKVEITGEAYFEVAHNKAMPFKVSKGQTEIEVLGTHFNVNSYDDEEALRVTLVEGSVKVSVIASSSDPSLRGTKQSPSLVLKPGQQASVTLRHSKGNSPLTIHHSPDLDAVLAWKNGLFSFNNSDLKTVMNQIARWYNVEVAYEGNIPSMRFGGEISRNSSAAQVLMILEKSKVKFRIEDKKIIVAP